MLDKGQEDDWFASPFITASAVIAAVALVSFVLWERKQEHPVVDVRLFKSRTFAAANVMMLTLGMALFGTTVLLPQYLQVLMGYTAQQSGMALSPGGFVVIMLLPFVGMLVSRVDARYMIAFGFVMLSGSLFYMTNHLYDGIDFRTAVQLRIFQSVGLAFLFVPINTLVYVGRAAGEEQRGLGHREPVAQHGRRHRHRVRDHADRAPAQFHQDILVVRTSNYDPTFASRIAGLASTFERAGASTVEATRKAMAMIYFQVQHQASTLAFLDALKALAIATGLMVPLLFLTQRARPGGAPAAH